MEAPGLPGGRTRNGGNGAALNGARRERAKPPTAAGIAAARPARIAFPFAAIVGQDEMRHALLAAAVDPGLGGVLVLGDRGTGKSTAVRALAALLPPMQAVAGCRCQ